MLLKLPLKLFAALYALITAVVATSFGADSVAITSQDVANGLTTVPGLTDHYPYRVYADYTNIGVTADTVPSVSIKGFTGAFNVVELSNSLDAPSAYILSNNNIVYPPVTIVDNAPTHAKVPYTIYIVAQSITPSPVVSVKRTHGQVIPCNDHYTKACTILSPYKNFQIERIDTGSANSVAIYSTGYDTTTEPYMIMRMNSAAVGSSLLVSGPVATLVSECTELSPFSFVLKNDTTYRGSIVPGASTTFLSNGWLRMDEAYAVAYVDDDLNYRSIDFGRETKISFNAVIGNFKAEDSFLLLCKHEDGQTTTYDGHKIAAQDINEWCKTLTLNMTTPTAAADQPRFMVQVESGALSTSMFTMMIASLLSRLLG